VTDTPLAVPSARSLRAPLVRSGPRVHRRLHPVAWWIWAAGVAVAASRTRNPVVLALLAGAVGNVAIARRQPGPAGHALGVFVRLGVAVIAIRMALTVLVGTRLPGTTLVTLPSVDLPEWAAGVSIGGPVTAEQLAGAFYAGLQLAVILCAFGAVNAVSSASRLLRSLPPVLHEAGVAVGVAVSLAPQLVVSVGRVRAARRLRGRPGGIRGLGGTVMPVLEDALERAVRMAASMDVRGYGRTRAVPAARRRVAGAALGVGLVGLLVGTYALLDGTAPAVLRLPTLVAGTAAVVVGLGVAGRRVRRTNYRPDPWAAPEWGVSACGVLAVIALVLADGGGVLVPSVQPLRWPTVTVAALVPVLAAVAPAWIAPPQPGVTP
jgi:energy-coupling factor transport system permease protein